MDEREKLKERITSDMALRDSKSIYDSFVIAQEYEKMGYDLPHADIRDLVREVALEVGVSVS